MGPLRLCLENADWANSVHFGGHTVKFCIMAGTAVPRSHRGTGVSPMKDWAVQAASL